MIIIVVRLEHDAHVKQPRAVPWSDRLPVASAGKQRAAQAFAFEAAAGNDADAPVDAGCVADVDRRLHIEQQDEQRTRAELRHFFG
jgi:hypothetical protein